jgi:hypothetical protein
VRDRSGEALTLDRIGFIYSDLGEKQKALDEYSRSMALSLEVGDPLIQKVTLGHLMKYWRDQKQANTAVFFGKQAITTGSSRFEPTSAGWKEKTSKAF